MKRKRVTNPRSDKDTTYEYHSGGYNFFDNRPIMDSRSSRLRIWCHNLDKLGDSQPERIKEELAVIAQSGMDIICWQDLSSSQPAWDRVVVQAKKVMGDNFISSKSDLLHV